MSTVCISKEELRRWFCRGRALWFGAISIMGLYLSAYNVPIDGIFPAAAPITFTDRIRWVGILLEALSIGLIAYELSKSVVAYNGKGLARQFISWFSDIRFVVISRDVIVGAIGTSIGTSTSIATAITRAAAEDIGTRVRNLENNLRSVQASIASVNTELQKTKQELHGKIAQETQRREAGDQAIHEGLEEQLVGDVGMQVCGLALLVLSIFLANAPAESAWVLLHVGLGLGAYW